MIYAVVVLSCVVVGQQIFFLRQVHKLLEKLMARSLGDLSSFAHPAPIKQTNAMAPKEEDFDERDATIGSLSGIF